MFLNPLRYPGSKADLVHTIDQIIRDAGIQGVSLWEPYAGSAAISMGLLELNTVRNVVLNERDPLLFAFWHCVFDCPERLADRFLDLEVSLRTWHRLAPLLEIDSPKGNDLVQLGVAALFFNRANFSGIIHGGPIGGHLQKSQYKIDCRTNKDDIIVRIAQLSSFAGLVDVRFGDGLKMLGGGDARPDRLYYIDPPYFVQGERLYRYSFRHGDHKRLAAALKRMNSRWILSYDKHYVIESLYEAFSIRTHGFFYSANSRKRDQELVIANFPLPDSPLPQVRVQSKGGRSSGAKPTAR